MTPRSKRPTRKLMLRPEEVRRLNPRDLAQVRGGGADGIGLTAVCTEFCGGSHQTTSTHTDKGDP